MKFETHNIKHKISFTPLVILVMGLFLGFVDNVSAEATYKLLEPLPGVPEVTGFPDYVGKIIPIVLGAAAVLAVVMITYNGIKYGVSEAIGTKSDAVEGIKQALFGLLIALLSFIILRTISPELINLKFDIKPVNTTQNSGGASGN